MLFCWVSALSKVIRVRYEGGVFKPLEPVEFEEGEVITIVSVERRVARGLVEIVESLRKETPKVEDTERIIEDMRK